MVIENDGAPSTMERIVETIWEFRDDYSWKLWNIANLHPPVVCNIAGIIWFPKCFARAIMRYEVTVIGWLLRRLSLGRRDRTLGP